MNDLALHAPDPIAPVPLAQAAGLVPIEDDVRREIEIKVDRYIADLVAIDAYNPDFAAKADQLSRLGQREVTDLADQSGRFLDRQTRVADSDVGSALAELRGLVETLDPARKGDLLQPRRILGIIPAGSKLKAYFDQYAPAQARIEALLRALGNGRDTLMQDNIAIEGERRTLWRSMGKLEEMIHLTRTLDARLDARATQIEPMDPAKARAVRESALFHVRQRTTDLLTQMAVAVQGYLALDLVKKNNLELIKGVDRASTTTIAALRTAITVARALAGQQIVLDMISALNTTASNMIESSGDLLRNDSARIQDQAASATVQIESLQRAFGNIYATMDAINSFKADALDTMKRTADALSAETQRAKNTIAHANREPSG